MHTYLGDRLESANLIVFIGFAFRDEHINRVITDRVRREARVVVINPDKSVLYPLAQQNTDYIRQGFNRESINAALDLRKTKDRIKKARTQELIDSLSTDL